MVASSGSRASVSARAGAAAMASDFGTNSAGWENSTGSASLGEMITRVPMRTLSNSFSAKPKGHPHAAVRGRISGQRPAVQRDVVPGDAQHVRHPGIVIEARAMVLVLLHDAEDAGWRLASRSSGPNAGPQGPSCGA